MGKAKGAADHVSCIQTGDGVLVVVIGQPSRAPFDVLELFLRAMLKEAGLVAPAR